MNHKQTAAHIRNRLKTFGVPARVRMGTCCGSRYVSVIVPKFDYNWTSDHLETIAVCAKVNGLTLVRGLPIDIRQISEMSGKGMQLDFYMKG